MDSSWSLSFSAAGAPSCFAMSEDIFLNVFFKSFLEFFFRPLGYSVQKRDSRGDPNDLWDVRSKNVTHAGSRMTFGIFGPKT